MHSKWKIGDFFKSGIKNLETHKGIIFFYGYDPLVFFLFKTYLKEKHSLSSDIAVKLGTEINTEWIENEFKTLSFFNEDNDIIIHDSEGIQAAAQEMLLRPEELSLESRVVLVNFSKKNTFFNKVSKLENPHVKIVEIIEPFFWEEMMVLDFLQEHLKVYLSFPAKNYIKDHIPFGLKDYYDAFQMIKLNFPASKELGPDDIASLISLQKTDPFELAEYFGGKKLKAFYQKLLSYEQAGHDLIGMISFVQSHMIKVYDTSYAEKKKKLSKYDKLVMAQSKLWSKDQINRSMNYLGKLLIALKSKDSMLINRVRSDLLSLDI